MTGDQVSDKNPGNRRCALPAPACVIALDRNGRTNADNANLLQVSTKPLAEAANCRQKPSINLTNALKLRAVGRDLSANGPEKSHVIRSKSESGIVPLDRAKDKQNFEPRDVRSKAIHHGSAVWAI